MPGCVYTNLNLWLPMCLPRRMSTHLCSGGLWWAAFCWWSQPWVIFAGGPRGVTAPRPLWDFSREHPHSLPSLAICAELTRTDPLAEALRCLQSNHCNPLAPTGGEWRGFKHSRPNAAFTLQLPNQSVIYTCLCNHLHMRGDNHSPWDDIKFCENQVWFDQELDGSIYCF